MAMQAALGEDFTLSGSRSLVGSDSTPLGRLPSKDWTHSLTDSAVRLPDAHVSTVAPPERRAALAVLVLAALVLVFFGVLALRGPSAGPLQDPPAQPAADSSLTSPPNAAGRVEVWVRSTPEGARVARAGEDLGNTPARLLLGPNDRWTLTLSAPGHVDRTLRVLAAQREVNVVLEAAVAEPAAPTDAADERPHGDVTRPTGTSAMDPAATERPTSVGTPRTAGSMSAPSAAPEHRTDNRDPWNDEP